MHTVRHYLEVDYSASDMYSLVNDVESYSSFLPYCTESCILKKEPHQVIARLTTKIFGFSCSVTTRNTLDPSNCIRMELVEGPFKHLAGTWEFTSLGDEKSKIQLTLEFKFSSRIMQLLPNTTIPLNSVSEKLIDAFKQRAAQLKAEKSPKVSK